jgi:hypothetical protein
MLVPPFIYFLFLFLFLRMEEGGAYCAGDDGYKEDP